MNLTLTPEVKEETLSERHNKILSLISHDLKSPLTAIIGCSSYLLSDIQKEAPNQKWIEMLQIIAKAGQGVLKLSEDILAMAKLEAGKEKVEPAWVNNLGDELRDVIKTFQFEADARNIGLYVEIVTSLPDIFWDMRRIRYHVINNVISNALKFTPSGGSVTLSAEAKPGIVLLRIEDTGPGISEHEANRIFQRFEQIDLKSARVSCGAGLGLSNARLFVEQHGGTIFVDNNPEQKGAVFVIEIPVNALQREGGFGFDNAFSENKKRFEVHA